MTAPHANTGLIGLFVRHPTASNLLMAAMIIVGVFALSRLNTQFFPTIEIPSITVTVAWPGASADDVEANILDALEPELRFLDDVEQSVSIAREGAAVINLEFEARADMQKALSDVEQAITSVTTLPEDAEEPVIKRLAFFDPVANISVSGPFSEAAIKAYAKQIRDGLLAAGIDRVDLNGSRDEEIWVKVKEYDLRRLNYSVEDIAKRIKDETRDLPSGTIEGASEVQLRALADRRTPDTIGKIVVKPRSTGEKLTIKDFAEVETRFDRDAKIGVNNGVPAIELTVQRAVSADTLKTMAILENYLEKAIPTLPPSLKIEKYKVRGKFVVQRINILLKNGLQGLVLVLIILFIFLNARIAFWVAAGIPVALLATLAVMYMTGQTINMISMFGLIMMLGIIVDDAIVVGEHTATRLQMGDSRLEAAERGATRMLPPVMAATLTTQAAFLPMLLITGRLGDIMAAIPIVVMAVLIASLIECFLILPGHLRHGASQISKEPSRFRKTFDRNFNQFRDGSYKRFVDLTYRWRYTTTATALAVLTICIGLIAGGRIGFTFFPSPEAENIKASVVFAAGTPSEDQTKAMNRIDDVLRRVEKELGGGKDTLIESSFITLGQGGGRAQGDNLAQIDVQLTASEVRSVPTATIRKAWRKALPKIPGIERIAIIARRPGPPGRDLDIRLIDAPIETLKKAAEELKTLLTGFPGVSGINDDLPYGKKELVLEVNAKGTALGFSAQSIGTQVRNAFEGAIATRFARGDEEITIRVMRVQQSSDAQALKDLYVRGPSGDWVPLTEVVTITDKQGFSVIQRIDGKRTIGVTADVDPEVTSVIEIVAKLEKSTMPQFAEKHGLSYEYKGRDEERRDAFKDLKTGVLVALLLIYIILAWVFKSYFQPLAVMSIIPFGFVGAALGHMVMGFPLTIISMIGLLGLSGILVNDSIILVTQVNRRLAEGNTLEEAAVGAAQDRLRAVTLTSLTTIGGLLPLLFETSRQAQFLIPMAVTMVFGLAAATILVLVLVPALIGVGGDISRFFRFVAGFDQADTGELKKAH